MQSTHWSERIHAPAAVCAVICFIMAVGVLEYTNAVRGDYGLALWDAVRAEGCASGYDCDDIGSSETADTTPLSGPDCDYYDLKVSNFIDRHATTEDVVVDTLADWAVKRLQAQAICREGRFADAVQFYKGILRAGPIVVGRTIIP